MMKKIYYLVLIGMIVSFSLTGCGKKASNKKTKATTATTKKSTEGKKKTTTTTEKATVEQSEDGNVKIKTESGEEISIDTSTAEVTQEADGSKVYSTPNGQKVKIEADGSATVTTQSYDNTETDDEVQVLNNDNFDSNNNYNTNNTNNTSGTNSSGNSQDVNTSNNQGNTDQPVQSGNDDSNNNDDSNSSGNVNPDACRNGNHAWGNETIIKEPTCNEDGIKRLECQNCHTTLDVSIPCLGHNAEWVRTKEPTIYEEGEESFICHRCGQVLSTRSICKLENPGLEDSCWTYDSSTQRHKTMFDGTVVTEYYYETASGACWGYFDREAAEAIFVEIQKMQDQVYGEGDHFIWDESEYENAKAATVHYAVRGVFGGLYHMNSGGLPNVKDNRKYITFMQGYGCGEAIACFVIDSAGGSDNFHYGEWWRCYYGTYYSSPT